MKGAAILAPSAAGLAVCLGLGGLLIKSAGPTYDEPVHLASGYSGLVRGRPLNWRNHPPLAEMWAALPLLALRPALLETGREWHDGIYGYADAFLYQNRVAPERLLDSARFWCLLSWSALLLPAVAAWAYALGGAPAAWVGALLLAACPAWFTNAALVTTDAAPAAFYFLAFFFLSRPGRGLGLWAVAGAAAGLACASKFNMIAAPAFMAAALAAERRLVKPRSRLGSGPWLAAAIAVVCVIAAYRGDWARYWGGLTMTFSRLNEGRSGFLAGRYSLTGWLWYFPAAVALKTPLAFLLLAAGGVALRARKPDADGLWLAAPAAVYFAAACASKTQIGYRHVLPVYPFLAVLGGCAAARLWASARGKAVLAAAFLWLAVDLARTGPHYLAYFNELAGGPERGWTWLADSNLDWGQDLKSLAEELHKRGDPPIFLSYFGVGDPSAYGIRYFPVAWFTNVLRRDGVVLPSPKDRVLLAVSATNLDGVYYADHDAFAWLRARTPVAVPGHSIFLYDLTADPDGRTRLGALLTALKAPPELAKRTAGP